MTTLKNGLKDKARTKAVRMESFFSFGTTNPPPTSNADTSTINPTTSTHIFGVAGKR